MFFRTHAGPCRSYFSGEEFKSFLLFVVDGHPDDGLSGALTTQTDHKENKRPCQVQIQNFWRGKHHRSHVRLCSELESITDGRRAHRFLNWNYLHSCLSARLQQRWLSSVMFSLALEPCFRKVRLGDMAQKCNIRFFHIKLDLRFTRFFFSSKTNFKLQRND